MSALLALESYHQMKIKHKWTPSELIDNLHLNSILQEASDRADSVIISELLPILKEVEAFKNHTVSKLFTDAMNNSDHITMKNLIPFFSQLNLTPNHFIKVAQLLANNQTDQETLFQVLQLSPKSCKDSIALIIVTILKPVDIFLTLNKMSIKIPKFCELPTFFHHLPFISNFEVLQPLLSIVPQLKPPVCHILFESLLRSANHLGRLDSDIYIFNYLIYNGIKLEPVYVDILCHSFSKTAAKMTSVQFMNILRKHGVCLSNQNYLHLLKPHFCGTESDTMFYILNDILNVQKAIPKLITEYLVSINKHLNDSRIEKILTGELIDPGSLDNEAERTKHIHNILPDFNKYYYEEDGIYLDSLTHERKI
ncbi:hypothetical protein DAMA08_004320 [Martiniozyma asiatica (nom. inval.)]|nr:hypothetical protein DAMA08_004320 [Martiniozyma asiatica]